MQSKISELSVERRKPLRATKHATVLPFAVPLVSVVIPAKNEAKNLPHILPRIPSLVGEVLLVDGHSTDDTIAVARRLRPDIRIIHQTGKGKGDALRLGFESAAGDIIVMLDADGSMAPEEIPAFVGALIAGADYAKGSRFLHGAGTEDMEFHRYLGNLGLVMAVRLLFGGTYSDLCYGYCAFWSRVLPTLSLNSDGFEIETEMNVRALRSKIKVVEVPSFESRRIYGESNLHAVRDGLRVLRLILSERFGKRMPRTKRAKPALTTLEFMESMKALQKEATFLAMRRHELPMPIYESSAEALKSALLELLTYESGNPHVQRQQEQYQQQMDSLWSAFQLSVPAEIWQAGERNA
jgi:glycosyltransferase involved in cell wall biosynthesis